MQSREHAGPAFTAYTLGLNAFVKAPACAKFGHAARQGLSFSDDELTTDQAQSKVLASNELPHCSSDGKIHFGSPVIVVSSYEATSPNLDERPMQILLDILIVVVPVNV